MHKEGDVYGVVFPDLPGCVSVGDTQAELAINAAEALSGHLEAMMDHGERIPPATAIETITLESSEGDIAVILVTAYAAPAPRAAAE
jgi:predicted RNase H-like HicB family nuclease